MRDKSLAAALGLTLYAVCAFTALPAFAQTADTQSYNGDTDDAVTSPMTPEATAVASPVASASPEALASPDATAAAAPEAEDDANGALNPNDSMQDQIAQMENRVLAQQAQIRRLRESLEQVNANANAQAGETLPEGSDSRENQGDMLFDVAGLENNHAGETPLVWRRLSLLVNLDLEYTSQYDSTPAGGIGTGNGPDFVQPSSPNGQEGMYFGHVDLDFKYQFNDSMFAKVDYNLSALELDDVGVGWQQLAFPPFTSGWGDFTYSIFVGQKRQFFGLEQQTDDRNLMFPNRAMMFGGPNPFGGAREASSDPFDLYDQATTIGGGQQSNAAASNSVIGILAYQRTMGVHLFHAHDFGFLNYNLGVDIVNDESEDSVPGGGTDSLKTGFPLQTEDQDVSEIGRFGLQPSALNDLLPFGGKFAFGASAFHDPENTALYASQSSQEEWADAQGLDATFQTDADVLYLQSEYVKRDQYGPSFTTTGLDVNNEYGGLQGRAESWYVAGSFQPWRIFDPDAPRVELLARYESYYYDDVSNWLRLALGPYTGSYNATTVALKYTYMGNCHTSVNYTTYGLDNNFSATGPTALLQLEQQVNF